MRLRTLLALCVLVAVGALGLAACGGDDESAETTTPAPAGDTGGMEEEAADIDVMSPAADLRVALDTLLGEHAALAMAATQKGFAGDEDFEAIAAALDENSVELSEAIGSVYGDEAAETFLDGENLWRDHISFFVDYTVGLAGQDRAAQNGAVDSLTAYITTFSGFLAEATGLPQDAVEESINMHVMQLKGQIDAYSKGNYDAAYSSFREAYGHMYMTGDTLAQAIQEQSPDNFALEPATQSAVDLRVALDQLFGEHAILAMLATQKGYSGDEDFETIAAVLDENSVELSEAIGSVYGDEAAETFLDGENMWRDHISFFVDYTVGLAQEDEAAQQQAVDSLTAYITTFSGFLAEATGLPQEALEESITEHVMQLKGQIDAYAAGDYEEAYDLFRGAYGHMIMTGDTLAGAIVQQNPDMFSD